MSSDEPQFNQNVLVEFQSFLADSSARIRFQAAADPLISVVLLTYNKAELTYGCLKSLQQTLSVPYEIIIVDNASKDQTAQLLARVDGGLVILNPTNLYYARGIHVGAERAKGKYLLLLNSDIQLFPGFDKALLSVFEAYPDAGAVGGQLILPDGTLQEAGCMVNDQGVPWGYGRTDRPDHWQYQYVREVDYCSAAVLLVNRALFWRVGGFELAYEPAYFEDTDLCMKLREAGAKVYYTPFAKSFHYEHGTSNRFWVVKQLEKNRRLFLKRWKKVLSDGHHSRKENKYRARERDMKPKILMIDNRVPVSGHGGGYPRAFKIIQTIRKLGYSLTLFPLKKDEVDTGPWEESQKALRFEGVEVVSGPIKFTDFLRERAGQFDLIWVSRYSAMDRVFFDLKALLPEIPIIYDSEAINFERMKLKAEFERNPIDAPMVKTMEETEKTFFSLSEQVVVVSGLELKKISNLVPEIRRKTTVLGHALPPRATVPPPSSRKDIYFVGGFLGDFGLNEHAILFFLDNVFPALHRETDCQFNIIGANIPEIIRARAGNGVFIRGFVESLTDVYDHARLMVMPHQYAGGIPLKLVEALSFGVPSVVSPLIAGQLELKEFEGVLIASEPIEYVSKCKALLKDDQLWNELSEAALHHVRDAHSTAVWEGRLAGLLSKMENVE